MTKERKQQAIKLLKQAQNGIVIQQSTAISKVNIKLYRKLQDEWGLMDEIIDLISEAPEDD